MKPFFDWPFYIKAPLVLVGLFVFIYMLFITQGIVVPIIYSTIIAIVLSPLVHFFVKLKMGRLMAITLTMLLVITATVCSVLLLSSQVMQFSNSLPAFFQKFHQLSDKSIVWVSTHFNISTVKINEWLTQKNAEIINGSGAMIGQTLLTTGGILIILVLIPVYVFMILYYQPLLVAFMQKLFSNHNAGTLNQVLTASKKIIQSYLVGLLLEALIVAVLDASVLLILGIDYAILLGVIGALINMVPFIGGIVAVALPMLIAISTKGASYALLVLVSYIVIQFIDNHFISPKIVASKVKINALVSVIAVIAGNALWGIPGMFLSIPLTAILKVIFDKIEGMQPWGYLLGNIVPTEPGIVFLKQKLLHINKMKKNYFKPKT